MNATYSKPPARWLLAAAAGFWACAATAADEVKAAPRGLSPEQIRSVQIVGRAVLAAKHSQVEDPNHVQLRDRVRDLRRALDAVATVAPEARRPPSTATEQPGDRRARDAHATLDDTHPLTQDLRARRRAMRAGRDNLERELRRRPTGDRQAEFHAAAAKKVEEIERDIEEALSAPPENRRAKLLQLRSRLAKPPIEPVQAPEPPAMSTIVRHRE